MSIRPWSLTPWSLPYVEGEALEDSVDFLEYMDCVAGVSDEDYDAAEFRVRLEGELRGSAGAPDEADFAAKFALQAMVIADVEESAEMSAELFAPQTDIEAIFSESFSSSLSFDGVAMIAVEMADAAQLTASLLFAGGAGVIQYEAADLTEIISVVIGVQTISQTVIALSVTLQPGEMLTLNAEDYTAALGGVNALHLVDGWVVLDSEVVETFVDSGLGGELSGNLRYRERWY